jgi:hypothetical protein
VCWFARQLLARIVVSLTMEKSRRTEPPRLDVLCFGMSYRHFFLPCPRIFAFD